MKDLLFWLKTSDKFWNTSSEIISISNEIPSISKMIYQSYDQQLYFRKSNLKHSVGINFCNNL